MESRTMRMVRLAREILDSIEFDDDRHAIARELAALAIAEHDPELHAIMFANREHDPWGVGGPR